MLGAVLYGPRDVPKIIQPTDAIITVSATSRTSTCTVVPRQCGATCLS